MKTTKIEDSLSTDGDAEDVYTDRNRLGIQSIEAGSQPLVALTRAVWVMVPGDLAHAADMHPSRTHRYLVSLQYMGVVSQDPPTGRYELGPFTLRPGLASLNRSDAIIRMQSSLAGLRDQTGHTIDTAVWNDHGSTVAHWEKVGDAPGMNLRIGDVPPIFNSVTGRLFGAYQSMEQTLPLVERELHERADGDLLGLSRSLMDYYRLCEGARIEDTSWVSSSLLSGVNALSLLVFDARGQLVLVLIALNLQPPLHVQRGGELEHTLRTLMMYLSVMPQASAECPTRAGSH